MTNDQIEKLKKFRELCSNGLYETMRYFNAYKDKNHKNYHAIELGKAAKELQDFLHEEHIFELRGKEDLPAIFGFFEDDEDDDDTWTDTEELTYRRRDGE